MTTAKSGLTLSGRWKILHLLLKIPNAHSTYLRALHKRLLYNLFLTLRLGPPKGQSIILFSTKPSSPTKKYGKFGPSVPERGLSLDHSSIFV